MRIGDSRVLIAGCLIALMPTVARAQADRYAPTVLQIAPTPRMSTFGSGTAARDIEAIFSNPAMVGAAVGTIVGMGRFDAATQLTLAHSAALGPFNVGIGASYLDFQSQTAALPFWSYAL